MLWISHGHVSFVLRLKFEIKTRGLPRYVYLMCAKFKTLITWQILAYSSKFKNCCTQWEELLIYTRKGNTSSFGIKKEKLLVAFHSITVLISITRYSSFFSNWWDFRPIRWIRRIGQNHWCMNMDPFPVSQKHIKYSSVMVKVLDCQANNPGSVPGRVSDFFVNFNLLNSSH